MTFHRMVTRRTKNKKDGFLDRQMKNDIVCNTDNIITMMTVTEYHHNDDRDDRNEISFHDLVSGIT